MRKNYVRLNKTAFAERQYLRNFETYQKIAFGVDYVDENLTELIAKLYLMMSELDAAEQKINILSDVAQDNLTKVRALNLQSDLLNRRGNYREALEVAQAAEKLLKVTPDKNLSLINYARAARAFFGLGETKKALIILNKINQPMHDTFGENAVETRSMVSTIIEICLKDKKYEKAEAWLKHKCIQDFYTYEQTNAHPDVAASDYAELANFYFETQDAAQGEKFLTQALIFADKCYDANNPLARNLYKEINRIAVKNLDENHRIVLYTEFYLSLLNSYLLGAVPQAIEFYEKSLPTFKKVFGEDNVHTIDMMDALIQNYLSLGKYADAQKIAEEKLRIFKKHSDEHYWDTVESTIDLAEIYYKQGKYKTADKLLAAVQADNPELFAKSPTPEYVYNFFFKKANGARMRGDIFKYTDCLWNIDDRLEKDEMLKKMARNTIQILL